MNKFLCLALAVLFFTSCQNDENKISLLTDSDIENVQQYNAFFDFFEIIETLDFKELQDAGFLTAIENDEYAIHYEIEFPENHLDARGNNMEGKLLFLSKMKDMDAVGNVKGFEFDDFSYNKIGVIGAKSQIISGIGGIDWCNGSIRNPKQCDDPNSDLQFVFPDNTTAEYAGTLHKEMSGSTVEITGSHNFTANGISYSVDIEEPMIQNSGCAWFTAGQLKFSGERSTVMTFGTSCNDARVNVFDETMTEMQTLEDIHNYWQ